MADEYGDCREKLGRMLERKEIMEGLMKQIDVCIMVRDQQKKNSLARETYTLVVDSLMFVAKSIQRRGVE